MPGRRPKPIQMHQLAGNPSKLSKDELEGKDNPQPKAGTPEMPKGMPKAARRWFRRICVHLADWGVLNPGNGDVVAGAARCAAMIEAAEREIEKHGIVFITHFETKDGDVVDGDIKANPAVAIKANYMKLLKTYLCELGLTPSALRNIKVKPKEEDDPMQVFLATGKAPVAPLMTPMKPDEDLANEALDEI